MGLKYRLKTQTEVIGTQSLEVQSLANLNETIDQLFAELEKTGDSRLLDELCPYFGVVWPSARALTGYLASLELQGRSVLEVGCGLALPSLTAAKLGARVTATDFHPEVPAFLERNIAANSISPASLNFVRLDWQSENSPLSRFDWVIGSDVLYEKQHPPLVAQALARHLNPGGRVILADPGRPYLQTFVDEMTRLGFHHETIARTVPDDPAPKDIFILNFSRP